MTVTAEAPLIQSQSGERSFTVTTDAVENLPIGRAATSPTLTALTPGVQSGTGTTRLGGGGQNNIMMDGVSTMDTGNNGQMLQMNVEAIAEVKVLTAGYQAEYGRSSGLQITAVTKSGTNRFRGSVYDVERNSDWNANSWVNKKNGDPEDGRRSRRTGATRSAGRSASRAATTSCSSSTARSTGRARAATASTSSACRRRSSGRATSRRRSTTTARCINLIRDAVDRTAVHAGDHRGCFADGGVLGRIPQSALYPTGLNILKLWPEPNISSARGRQLQLSRSSCRR